MTQRELQAREELGIIPESKDMFGRRAANFDKLVEERVALKELQKQTEAELKDIDNKLTLYLADTESKTVLSGGVKVTQCSNPGQSKLSATMLIEHGVAATTIAECTLPGKPYHYILVTPQKVA
jgi:hypothetical protein